MNDCHCEAPAGQRSNLHPTSTTGGRLLRFARNDRLSFAALMAIFLLAAMPAHAVRPDEMLSDPGLEARAREVGSELRCLVCRNQSVDDSDADLAHADPQPVRDLASEELGPHIALFEPQEKKIAATTRFVGRDFFDHEIFRTCFEPAADTRKVGRQKRWLKCSGQVGGHVGTVPF